MSKYGECCEVMALALVRGCDSRLGLSVETMMNFKTGDTRDQITARFRKAKRMETGKYGAGTANANACVATVEFCPFCGAKGCKR